MSPQQHGYTREPLELSLGHDPDLIARYLAGEDLTAHLRPLGGPERTAPGGHRASMAPTDDAPSGERERQLGSPTGTLLLALEPPSLQVDGLVRYKHESVRFPQVPSQLPQRKHRSGPRWSLIAVAIALGAVFAISLWVTFR